MPEPVKFTVEKLRNSNEYTALAIGDYASSLQEMDKQGFAPVDIEKVAEHRIDLGVYHEISWTGTRTTDVFVHQNGEYFLAKSNPEGLLYDVDAAEHIQAYNENYREISLQQNYALEKFPISVDGETIPVEEFTTNPITKHLFGEQVEGYKEWLIKAGIPAFPIFTPNYSLVSHYGKNFIRPLIIRCTDNWSGLITANSDLDTAYGFRGSATEYNGELKTIETFKREQLNYINHVVPVENRDYSLPELEDLFDKTEYRSLLNPLLRLTRNGGTGLPANLGTFS